jgi:hypothetical protein
MCKFLQENSVFSIRTSDKRIEDFKKEEKMFLRDKICFIGGVKLAALAVIVFLACSSNNNVVGPGGPGQQGADYAIADYFPIHLGDRWIYEVVNGDSMLEPYRDGDSCIGEPFTDVDGDGIYTSGTDIFTVCGTLQDPCPLNQDLNYNGDYDGPNSCAQVDDVPFVDFDGNGDFDLPNGQYDIGEPFYDIDANGSRGYSHKLLLGLTFSSIEYISPLWCYIRQDIPSIQLNGFTVPSPYTYYKDVFSSDTSGLKWYKHGIEDISARPIVIAAESLSVGDSTEYIDTLSYGQYSYIVTWVSTLVGVEDVTVPAGTFSCLKFKSLATGWRYYNDGWGYDMSHFIFVTYQWYGEDVGLVKSEGPRTGQYMILKKRGW